MNIINFNICKRHVKKKKYIIFVPYTAVIKNTILLVVRPRIFIILYPSSVVLIQQVLNIMCVLNIYIYIKR